MVSLYFDGLFNTFCTLLSHSRHFEIAPVGA